MRFAYRSRHNSSAGHSGASLPDSTGAIVPGAEVSVVEVATNDTHVIVTGDSGTYVVPQLKPGDYRITVKKDGFKSPTFDQVKVDVGQVRAFDVTLEIGQTSEAVNVSASRRRSKRPTPQSAKPSKIDGWSICR